MGTIDEKTRSIFLLNLSENLRSSIADFFLKQGFLTIESTVSNLDLNGSTFPAADFIFIQDHMDLEFLKKLLTYRSSSSFCVLFSDALQKNEQLLHSLGVELILPSTLSAESQNLLFKSLISMRERMNSLHKAEMAELTNQSLQKIQNVYRDVILASTQNKLELILDLDHMPILPEETLIGEQLIETVADLQPAKDLVKKAAAAAFWNHASLFDIIVSVSEALSNVLKYAGSGTMCVYRIGNTIYVKVQDHGTGIRFVDLPKTALFKGYSTQDSLGMGFAIMLELMDKIYLHTDTNGTVIILRFEGKSA